MRSAKLKWLLLADIHFKHQDLDRITQTAAWITSVARQHQVRRVVICGDLLTSRSSQPTHVLSACYRFLESLVHDAKVPHVHVVLGNHDLAYRRDHVTTALDALRLASPVVQVHHDVGSHVWDGRRVLTLPFREDQRELAGAVAALGPREAAETVGFAHLAIHRAVTQRHVVRPSSDAKSRRTGAVRYHGLMGPGSFSSLARTFTGHFHSHQTILQQLPCSGVRASPNELDGSVTYVGSPLQLTWADLWDDRRGVVLLDPENLEHEFLVNPHAVGYVTANVGEVLSKPLDPVSVRDKHVMLLGDLTRYKYAAARDELISIGARSVRSWSPMAPRLQSTVALKGLGSSTPASDASLQYPNLEPDNSLEDVTHTSGEETSAPCEPPVLALSSHQPQQVDIREQVARYIEAVSLDESLENRRASLIQVGHKLLEVASGEQTDDDDQKLGGGEPDVINYKSIIPPRTSDGSTPSASQVGTTMKADLTSSAVFYARPRSLTITNFLGIQSSVHLVFGTDIKPGLTFVVGENGSGKSTLVEAMVWCQFGRCLRSGLGVNDVVNDKAKRDCSVRLEFDNGYAITRYRKHKEYGNRILVERDGKTLLDFEKPDARSTQAAIDELLGVSYETFVRTIVLGHESATSFLSSTPVQRRDLIVSFLGLGILDRCAVTTRRMARELADDMSDLQSKINALEQAGLHTQDSISQLVDSRSRLEVELEECDLQLTKVLADLDTSNDASISGQLDEQIAKAHRDVEALLHQNTLASIRRSFEAAKATAQERYRAVLQHVTEMEAKYLELSSREPHAKPHLHRISITSWLVGVLQKAHDSLQSCDASLASTSSHHSSPSTLVQRLAKQSVVALLAFLRGVSAALRSFPGVSTRIKSRLRMDEELFTHQASLENTKEGIQEQRQQLSSLESLTSDSSIIQHVASQQDLSEKEIQDALEVTSAEDLQEISARLSSAVALLAKLQTQRELFIAQRSRLTEIQAARKAITEKIATYEQIIASQTQSQNKLDADRDALQDDMAALAEDRALVDFWVSALAQKSRRISSASSSSSSSTTTSQTFREFVLEQSLAELNTVTTQILAILFEDSRHAAALTTGMLRHLFSSDEQHQQQELDDGVPASVLDSSLAVDARLSYGKRSGGERKRIDLALFFALLYVGHARSRHRAQYMLVDEVFDSLDAAGQAAVVRWCEFMAAARVAHVVIITHSEELVSQGVAAGGEEAGGGGAVLAARMGEDGVELEMDGRKLG